MSTYQDSQDGLTIASSSRPPNIKVVDTVEVKIKDEKTGNETWEAYVVYHIDDETGKFYVAGVRDLDDQEFCPDDFSGSEIRRAAQPAMDKSVAVFARVELCWRKQEQFMWDSPLMIGEYKFIHTFDPSRPTARDFRAYHLHASNASNYICKGLKPLAGILFAGNKALLDKAMNILRPRQSTEPRQSLEPSELSPAGASGATAQVPVAPLAQADVDRLRKEAEEAEVAVQDHEMSQAKYVSTFKREVQQVSGEEDMSRLAENFAQSSKRGRETQEKLAAERQKKRAKADVARELLQAEAQEQADEQELEEARAAVAAREQDAQQSKDKAKALRERLAAA